VLRPLVLQVTIQQFLVQAQVLLQLVVPVADHKDLQVQIQAVLAVVEELRVLQEHLMLEAQQRSLANHKLCRPEVIL
jgi:hypothetical protein